VGERSAAVFVWKVTRLCATEQLCRYSQAVARFGRVRLDEDNELVVAADEIALIEWIAASRSLLLKSL
jgi:hypothetical protein